MTGKFRIEVAKSVSDEKRLAALALKNRLYVSGWMLSGWLQKIKNGHQSAVPRDIAVGYLDDVPVVVVTRERRRGFTATFVRKENRLQGFGSKVVRELYKQLPMNKFLYGWGIEGSCSFYRSLASVSQL